MINNSKPMILKRYIFVLGGYNGPEDHLRKAEKTSIDNVNWVPITSMIERRQNLAAVVFEETIYVAGGLHHGDRHVEQSVEKFDTVRGG